MRVVFDTNLLISYLLSTGRRSAITISIEAVFSHAVTLVLPREVVIEFARSITEKPYLAARIARADAEIFIQALARVSELPPPLGDMIPDVSRDDQDDFLLAYTVIHRPDFLVSGDKDVRAIGEIDGISIVNPAEFARILMAAGIIGPDQLPT